MCVGGVYTGVDGMFEQRNASITDTKTPTSFAACCVHEVDMNHGVERCSRKRNVNQRSAEYLRAPKSTLAMMVGYIGRQEAALWRHLS